MMQAGAPRQRYETVVYAAEDQGADAAVERALGRASGVAQR